MKWTRRSVFPVLGAFAILTVSGCYSKRPATTAASAPPPTGSPSSSPARWEMNRTDIRVAIRQLNREAAAEARKVGWTVSDADVKTAEAQGFAAAEKSLATKYALIAPVDDAVLASRVVDQLNRLWKDKGRANVRVEVEKGTVTLYGSAPTLSARSDAEAVTWQVGGVRHVVNDISVLGKFP